MLIKSKNTLQGVFFVYYLASSSVYKYAFDRLKNYIYVIQATQ